MTTLVTGYHSTAFVTSARDAAVRKVTNALRGYPSSVGIVCTGISGILIAALVAQKTQRELAIVRKPNEKTHSEYKVEGYTFSEYVIVDDFIDDGCTVERILKVMHRRKDYPARCRAILLYDGVDNKLALEFRGEVIPIKQLAL